MYIFTPELLEDVSTNAMKKHKNNIEKIMQEIIKDLEKKTKVQLKKNKKWDFIDQGGQMQLVNNIYFGSNEILSFFGFVTNDDSYQYYYQRYDVGEFFFDKVLVGKACFLLDNEDFSTEWKNLDVTSEGFQFGADKKTPLWQGLNGILITYQRKLSWIALLNHFLKTIFIDPVYGLQLTIRTVYLQILSFLGLL